MYECITCIHPNFAGHVTPFYAHLRCTRYGVGSAKNRPSGPAARPFCFIIIMCIRFIYYAYLCKNDDDIVRCIVIYVLFPGAAAAWYSTHDVSTPVMHFPPFIVSETSVVRGRTSRPVGLEPDKRSRGRPE